MLEPSEIIVDVYNNCSKCSYQTSSVFQLDHHIQRNHRTVYTAELFHAFVEPEQFLCICCGYHSCYQFKMYEHLKQAHNPRSENHENVSFRRELAGYPCEYCKYELDSSLSLLKHHDLCEMEPRPRDRQNTGPTDEAGRGMETPSLVSSVKVDMLKCNYCMYRAKQKSTMNRHMLTHATDEEISWFECSHCSYRAKRKTHLKGHMLLHASDEEIRWFHCDRCSFRSKRKSHLKTHMMQHASKNEEISWIQCDHCSYRPKYKWQLIMHKMKHAANEEISWFQCSCCSYRGKRKSTLKRHMLQHAADDEISWFQCDRCSYRAKYKASLTRHMLQHAASEKNQFLPMPLAKKISFFQCSHCTYRANQKQALSRHAKFCIKLS